MFYIKRQDKDANSSVTSSDIRDEPPAPWKQLRTGRITCPQTGLCCGVKCSCQPRTQTKKKWQFVLFHLLQQLIWQLLHEKNNFIYSHRADSEHEQVSTGHVLMEPNDFLKTVTSDSIDSKKHSMENCMLILL